MVIDLVGYLKRKNAQKLIDEIALKYAGKKVFLYGAGNFAHALIENYDFSKLNILGIADKKFIDNVEGDFLGYTKFSPYDLLENEFDLILITAYDNIPYNNYIKKLFEGEDVNFEVKPLVKMNIFDAIKYMFFE